MTDDLPTMDLGTPGPMRDGLVAAVLSGAKTATTALLAQYRAEGEQLPLPGERYSLADSTGTRGTVELTEVSLRRLGDVGDDIAHAEGEGFADAAAWRVAHAEFWGSDPGDDDVVVIQFLRLLTPTSSPSP